jgi:selenocysteine lyase/cysteine desulfurase
MQAESTMAGEDTPLGTRKDFPICSSIAYLDNAFIAPIPLPVMIAGQEWLRRRAWEETDIFAMLSKVDEVREVFARFISAAPEEIGFLYTTAEGENVVCRALDLQPGDNIVTDDLAYPHTTVLGKALERSLGIDFRIVRHRQGSAGVEDFTAAVDGRTRLVVVPWVSNINGFRHDVRRLAELAHAHGAYLFVDAIQLVGTEPLDVKAEDIDFLCTGTYKWLMGGWGIAPFYVRRGLLDEIEPDRYGWQTALESPSSHYQYRHRTTAAKFEYASPSFDQFQTLAVALSYLEGLGLARIHAWSRELIDYLRAGLSDRGFRIFTPAGTVSPSLTFWSGAGRKETESTFRRAGVRVGFASGSRTSETYNPNPNSCRVRISPAHYNLRSDIDQFLEAAESLPRYEPPEH